MLRVLTLIFSGDATLYAIIALSLSVSAFAVAIAIVIGLPAGAALWFQLAAVCNSPHAVVARGRLNKYPVHQSPAEKQPVSLGVEPDASGAENDNPYRDK